jgi:hypothetical protein
MISRIVLMVGIVACSLAIVSCGGDDGGPNLSPDTSIVSGPAPGSSQSYRVGLEWRGTDPDGYITSYEYAWYSGPVPDEDLDTLLAWEGTEAVEDTFEVMADTCCVTGGDGSFHGYTFFVRAIDDDGAVDPTPAARSFTATTTPPRATIIFPERDPGQRDVFLPSCVTVVWSGADDDGEAAEFRYARKRYNDWPEAEPPYQDDPTQWSPWSTATACTIQLDQRDPENPWCFYVQAKDNAGAIETEFEGGRNFIRTFIDPAKRNLPDISISCFTGACIGPPGTTVGTRSTFSDTTLMDVPFTVDMNEEIIFRVSFSPGKYASRVEKIQYVEDDPSEPASWMDATKTDSWCYPKGEEGLTVGLGYKTIYVWVKDDYCEFGSTRRAHITIEGILP